MGHRRHAKRRPSTPVRISLLAAAAAPPDSCCSGKQLRGRRILMGAMRGAHPTFGGVLSAKQPEPRRTPVNFDRTQEGACPFNGEALLPPDDLALAPVNVARGNASDSSSSASRRGTACSEARLLPAAVRTSAEFSAFATRKARYPASCPWTDSSCTGGLPRPGPFILQEHAPCLRPFPTIPPSRWATS